MFRSFLVVPLALWAAASVGAQSAALPCTAGAQLTVPAGTILDLSLTQRTRLRGAGQAVVAQLGEPVYVHNQLALAAGTAVLGEVEQVEPVSRLRRVQAAVGGDFSPRPTVELSFQQMELADGRRLPLSTAEAPLTPALRLTSAPAGRAPGRIHGWWRQASGFARQQASGLLHFARAQADWSRLEQEAVDSLPYHPTELAAGSAYEARLMAPVCVPALGPAPLPIAAGPVHLPPGVEVHARLQTALSSATATWGETVRAEVDRPVLTSTGTVLIPEGAELVGQVTAVHPARRLGRGGELRFDFSQLQLPSQAAEPVQSRLQGVASGQRQRLDAEGGVRAAAPNAAPALALAVLLNSSIKGDADNAWTLNAGSGTHLRVWGTLLASVYGKWRPLALGLGYLGAGETVYRRFIARGQQVVFPRNTELEIHITPPPPHGPALAAPHP